MQKILKILLIGCFCGFPLSSQAQSIMGNVLAIKNLPIQALPIQGLPEFPPEKAPDAPLLDPEDLIPEKPLPDEPLPDFGQDKNAAERKEAELERLFKQLKTTANNDEAAKISRQIQGLWAQSGSDTVDLLMQWAEDGILKENYAMALDYIDNIIAIKQDYAEGWMRRAAIHVQLNDLKMAMFDLEKSLQYEPRNYNAIALLGTLMEMTGREELAIKAYQQALIYYPQNRRVQTRIGELLEKQTDRAI